MESRRPPPFDLNAPKEERCYVVEAGKPVKLLIRGSDLWRNPEIFIDNQSAVGYTILPDMAGIVAEFGPIVMPRTLDDKNPTVDLTVVTSNGLARIKNGVRILPPIKEATESPVVKFASPFAVIAGNISVLIPLNCMPKKPSKLQLVVRPANKGDVAWSEPIDLKSEDLSGQVARFTCTYNPTWIPAFIPDNMEMAGDILVTMPEKGAVPSLTNNKGVSGTFIHFKTDADRNASLNPKSITCEVQKDTGKTKVYKGVISIILSDLFYKAYPGLQDALENGFTLEIDNNGVKHHIPFAKGQYNTSTIGPLTISIPGIPDSAKIPAGQLFDSLAIGTANLPLKLQSNDGKLIIPFSNQIELKKENKT